MTKLNAVSLTVLLAIAPAMAAQVSVEHDHDVDLGAYTTFQYSASKEHTIQDAEMDEKVVAALEAMLQEGGLKPVDSAPDAFATYHINLEVENSFSQDQLGYDLGSAWGPYGSGTAPTDDYWTEGTLIVDLWDAKTGKAIWRAKAMAKVKDDQDENLKAIQKALDKMLAKWNKMRGKKR